MPHISRGPLSPFRLALHSPAGVRHVECQRTVQTRKGAMRKAGEYAGDIGAAGHIEVQERDGEDWRTLERGEVRDGVLKGWGRTW